MVFGKTSQGGPLLALAQCQSASARQHLLPSVTLPCDPVLRSKQGQRPPGSFLAVLGFTAAWACGELGLLSR